MLLTVMLAHGAETFGGHRYYLGDLHVHTGLSGDGYSSDMGGCPWDPCGAAEEVLDTAKAQGLDFVAVTDHITGGYELDDTDGFATMWERLLAGHDPEGGFVTIPGVELDVRVGSTVFGHKNVLLFGERSQLAGLTIDDLRPSSGGEVDSCDALWAWAEAVAALRGPVLLAPHHSAPSSPQPTDWSCHAEAWQPSVEVYSEHGNSMGGDDDFDPPFNTVVESGTVTTALAEGVRLGFHAATDTHDSMPGDTCSTIDGDRVGGGLTVAVLDEGETFDRAPIYDAMLERRTYGTSGPLVPARLAWSVGGELVGELGDDLELGPEGSVRVELAVPSDHAGFVQAVELVLPDGTEQLQEAVTGCWSADVAVVEQAYVRVTLDGGAWYGDEGCSDGGDDTSERLWLSPSWVTLGEEAAGEHAAVLCTEPVDSGSPDSEPGVDSPAVDSDVPADSPPAEEEPPDEGGCGCGGGAAGLWPLALLLALRRRGPTAAC